MTKKQGKKLNDDVEMDNLVAGSQNDGNTDNNDAQAPLVQADEMNVEMSIFNEGNINIVKKEKAKYEKKLTMGCSLKDINDKYGVGVALYFDSIKCLILLINFVYHLYKFDFKEPSTSVFDVIFVSSYTESEKTLWSVTTILAFVIALFTVWFYPRHYNRMLVGYGGEVNKPGNVMWENDPMSIIPDQMGLIESNLRVSRGSKRLRRFFSSVIYGIIAIILSGLLGFAIVEKTQIKDIKVAVTDVGLFDSKIFEEHYTSISVWDFVISILIVVFGYIGTLISDKLTSFEKHTKTSSYGMHKTVKLFFFKAFIVSTVTIFQRFAAMITDSEKECPMRPEAMDFFSIILTDLVVSNIIDWAFAMFEAHSKRKNVLKGKKVSPISFDVASENFELLYRQYVMYLGMSVFPLIVPFTILTFVIEYFLDKKRLVRYVDDEKKMSGDNPRRLSGLLFVMALIAFVMWPDGCLFTVFGNKFDTEYICECSVFGYCNNEGIFKNATSSSSSFLKSFRM